MEDWNGFIRKSSGFGVGSSISSSTTTKTRRRNNNNNEDFEEEDVLWNSIAHVNHVEDQNNNNNNINQDRPISHATKKKLMISSTSSSSSSACAWKLSNASTTPTKTPKKITQTTPKKVARDHQAQQSSAPMNVPDWSKIYGKNAASRTNDNDDDDVDGFDHGHDVDDDMVPPHEWIARKLARSQISSFSVCEGIGRTLKGRDLSKVRNAILTKTGFLE